MASPASRTNSGQPHGKGREESKDSRTTYVSDLSPIEGYDGHPGQIQFLKAANISDSSPQATCISEHLFDGLGKGEKGSFLGHTYRQGKLSHHCGKRKPWHSARRTVTLGISLTIVGYDPAYPSEHR